MLDLERFAPQPFVSKLLGMGDMAGLLEHVQALKLDQKDTMKHIAEGVFTVRDLRDQLANIMKMGPLSKMAGMIPGLASLTGGGGGGGAAGGGGGGIDDEEGGLKLRRMICICDSMTLAELDSDGRIFVQTPTRMVRVAKGSGTSVREVEDLLTQHRMMAGMAKKMKGGMQGMQRAQGMMGGANNKQQMAAMQKRMQSMGGAAGGGGPGGVGGAGGMPGMAGMSGMGGLPGGMDIGAMMKMLGGGGGGGDAGGMPNLGGMDMAAMMKMMGGGGGKGRR